MAKRAFELSDAQVMALRVAEGKTRDVHELRRLQAVRLYGSGQPIIAVEDSVGVSESTVRRWVGDYVRAGRSGLKPGWQGGNANKLSVSQRAELKEKLHTYRPDQLLSAPLRVSVGAFWTVSDLEIAVEEWFGVVYQSEESYRTLLYRSGFSYQRSEGVYRSQPSQAAIADFEADCEKK